MDSVAASLREWALYLAGMGWPVFPLKPGSKQPTGHRQDRCPRTGRCARGHQTPEMYATTDPTVIQHGWSGPFNIGIATGPAGLVVVDCDMPKPGEAGPDGATALAVLAAERGGPLPDTYTVATPSGGRHLYYRTPPGVRLPSTIRRICPAVDTRAWGGHVVGPGSTTPQGGYELVDDRDPVDLPAWLVQASLQPTTPATPTRTGRGGRARWPGAYAAAALRGECDRIRAATPGTHNAVMSTAAYRIGQLVGAGLLGYDTAHADLTTAARHLITANCQCSPAEIERVITAGLDAGTRNPRRITTKENAA